MTQITIRRERPDDYNAILLLTYEAFLTLDYPGRSRMDEHFLISLLRGSDSVISELSFVRSWTEKSLVTFYIPEARFAYPTAVRRRPSHSAP